MINLHKNFILLGLLTVFLSVSYSFAQISGTFTTNIAGTPVTIIDNNDNYWETQINAGVFVSATHLLQAIAAGAVAHGSGITSQTPTSIACANGVSAFIGSPVTFVTTAACGSCYVPNACGDMVAGDNCSGSCIPTVGLEAVNDSCFGNFSCGSGSISPNGSVECKFNLTKKVKSVCGFVDLTSNIPRPIPGLQNLDPELQSVRITNIQATTRFCLICQFYSLVDTNQLLGEAVKHQWVRVLRLGEN